ncbi:MAG: hypothetical protein ABIP75_05690 [Pyrinomonadaceae bacterium]
MNKIITLLILIFATAIGANAQITTSHYEKALLSFDYLAKWTFVEKQENGGANIVFTIPNSDLQLSVFFHGETFDMPEKLAEGKEKLVENTVKSYIKLMNEQGMKPVRTDGKSTIAGAEADVVHLRGSLDGIGGEAGIYYATINSRVVVISVFGPDSDLKRFGPALDGLRASIIVAAATPQLAPGKP